MEEIDIVEESISFWQHLLNSLTGGTGDLYSLLVRIALTVAVLLVAKIVIVLLCRTVKRVTARNEKANGLLASFLTKLISVLIWIVAAVIVLSFWGIDLTPVLTGLGITGVVLGFALQESISSIFSGIMIAINKPFRVGDWVEIGGPDISGTIATMDIMCITLRTGDNKKITVNNKVVWGSTITNFSYISKRRIDMKVSVAYGMDTEKAKAVIMDLIRSYPEVLADPAPVVEVNTFSGSSIDIIARPWVLPSDYWKVYWRFNAQILDVLHRNGLDMPYSHLVVHMAKEEAN